MDIPRGWQDEDTYWRTNFRSRPYAGSADYDSYRGAYRYGYESAQRYRDRDWAGIEGDLSKGWDSYEHRGKSTWQQVKDAVRDAWDRVASISTGS